MIFFIFQYKYKYVSSWRQERIDGFEKPSSDLAMVDQKLHPSRSKQFETRVLCAQVFWRKEETTCCERLSEKRLTALDWQFKIIPHKLS